MKMKKMGFIWIWGLLLLLFSGCAGPNLYSINMYYDAYDTDIPENIKNNIAHDNYVISVAEFTDIRKIDDELVIGRVIKSNGENVLVFPKNTKATKVVSNGVKYYLQKAGYKVAEKMEQWNLKEENIPQGNSKILVGGSIEELEIYCRKDWLMNAYTSNIKLNVVFVDLAKGKILYNTTVESSYSIEHILFSENILAEQADIVLADAIEKLFEDKSVTQKLKEVIARQN
jgi:broad-specificity NMP kinase